MSLSSRLEAVLFAVAKPLSRAQLSRAVSCTKEECAAALEELITLRNIPASGIHVLVSCDDVQLVSNPEAAKDLEQFVKQDAASELTRPSLETLTVIAYRGPVTKPEIEQIRGVNCSLIIRHLLMRDMIVEEFDATKAQPVYRASPALLRHLGVTSVSALPDYEAFSTNAEVEGLLQQLRELPPAV